MRDFEGEHMIPANIRLDGVLHSKKGPMTTNSKIKKEPRQIYHYDH